MQRLWLIPLVLISFSITGQDQPQIILSKVPWPGDWLPSRLDQMVSGEDFLGYPGPLVKMYYAFGMDQQHPGTDHDRLELVLRDSPDWYGNCNGWAGAATRYEEPDSLVVNGVKFFAGEVKALLSRPWKDTVETRLAGFVNGFTAREFHELLYDYIAQDRPLVFDVTIGDENWNYPVAGFTPVETQDGEWTNVDMTVYYTDAQPLNRLKENSNIVRFLTFDYQYRYRNSDPPHYEWRPGSSRPDRAWKADVPYFPGVWLMFSNRYWNLNDFELLQQKAATRDLWMDRFEPNQDLEAAASIDGSLAMGAVGEEDTDWFLYEKHEGEPLSLTLSVYDGNPVQVAVYDNEGNLLADFGAAQELDVLVPDHVAGPVRLELSSLSEPVSFYQLQRDHSHSWYRPAQLDDRLTTARLRVVNYGDESANLGAGEHSILAARSSAAMTRLNDLPLVRSDKDTYFAVEKAIDGGIWKRYFHGHQLHLGYEIPHMTCRNGWQTLLEIKPTRLEDITAMVYDTNGNLLESLVITAADMERSIDIGHRLTQGNKELAARFRLESSPENPLSGYVTFQHPTGYRADYDISSRPRNGVQFLADLPAPGNGWVGLSLLNTSGVDNEILLRLNNERGALVESGRLELAPGERWLGLPQQLFSSPVGENYHVAFFSQYSMESLALRHHPEEGVDYAHRLDGEVLDALSEAVITVPDYDHDTHRYVFANMNQRTNWILMEGYSAEGELITQIRPQNRAMKPYEILHVSLAELLAYEDIVGEDHGISYFKITTQQPLVLHELVGSPTRPNKTWVAVPPIYRYP
ncbi:MAG: hypothetical protein QNK37_26400 [Acidobacteriota bacterium]|nr:hypothetical protein [Acidobacteriota bacterium]